MTTLFAGFGKKEIVIAANMGGTTRYPDRKIVAVEGQEKIFLVRPNILVAGAGAVDIIQDAIKNLPSNTDLTPSTTAHLLVDYCEKQEEQPCFYIGGIENKSFVIIIISSDKRLYSTQKTIQENPDHHFIAFQPPQDKLTEWPAERFNTWAFTYGTRGVSIRKLAQMAIELLGEESQYSNKIPNVWVISREGQAEKIR